MIKAINSIWKNLLFDLIIGLILIGLVTFNFSENIQHTDFTLTDKLAMFAYGLLVIHLFVLIGLTIYNIIQKIYFKFVVFLLTSIGVYFGLSFIGIGLFFSTIGGPPIDEGNRNNFQSTNTCKQFDQNKIIKTIENLRVGIFSPQLDSAFLLDIKQNSIELPNKIVKIECGCRKSDTTQIVFRLWDIDKNTYELELTKSNEKWKYNKLSKQYLD